MATLPTIQCAIDVTSLLNGALAGTFVPSITAERQYVPRYELGSAETLKVFVVAVGKESEFTSRNLTEDDHEVDIAILQKLTKGGGDLAEVDPLLLLPQQIMDYLSGDTLLGVSRRQLSSGPMLTKINLKPIYSPADITEKQLLTSLITATYRGYSKFR